METFPFPWFDASLIVSRNCLIICNVSAFFFNRNVHWVLLDFKGNWVSASVK